MPDLFLNQNQDNAGYNNLTKFDGFYDNRYYDPMVSGYGFIFITKPNLFITPRNNNDFRELAYKNMSRDPYFAQFIESEAFTNSDKYLARLLSYDDFNDVGSFMPMFTNKLKNLETNDITLESVDSFDTKQGYKMTLPTHTTASESSSSLTLSVTESSNLDFTKLISLWVKYIANITDGTFDANPDMVNNGVIDYMSSIYYFGLEPDGRTIKYWCRYTGCWPTTIPYSSLRYNKGDSQAVELDIPFIYTLKEDMTPQILEDFNIVSLKLYDNLNVNRVGVDKYSGYQQIENNPYLTLAGLKSESALVDTDDRPPIVIRHTTPENPTPKFILSFAPNVNTNNYMKTVMLESSTVPAFIKATDTKIIANPTKDPLDVDSYFFPIDGDDGFFKL